MIRRTALTLLAWPLACAPPAPMPLDRAEELCLERARLAAGPRAEFRIGTGSRGRSREASITLSNDLLRGRDPAEVYRACVIEKSGQPPQRQSTQRVRGMGSGRSSRAG